MYVLCRWLFLLRFAIYIFIPLALYKDCILFVRFWFIFVSTLHYYFLLSILQCILSSFVCTLESLHFICSFFIYICFYDAFLTLYYSFLLYIFQCILSSFFICSIFIYIYFHYVFFFYPLHYCFLSSTLARTFLTTLFHYSNYTHAKFHNNFTSPRWKVTSLIIHGLSFSLLLHLMRCHRA